MPAHIPGEFPRAVDYALSGKFFVGAAHGLSNHPGVWDVQDLRDGAVGGHPSFGDLTDEFVDQADLKKALLDTRDLLIVEHAENDNYWADGGNGSGKIDLGRC